MTDITGFISQQRNTYFPSPEHRGTDKQHIISLYSCTTCKTHCSVKLQECVGALLSRTSICDLSQLFIDHLRMIKLGTVTSNIYRRMGSHQVLNEHVETQESRLPQSCQDVQYGACLHAQLTENSDLCLRGPQLHQSALLLQVIPPVVVIVIIVIVTTMCLVLFNASKTKRKIRVFQHFKLQW